MNSLYEALAMVRAVISDARCSIKVTKTTCNGCGRSSWDDWNNYQIRHNLDAALNKVEKAMEFINVK